MKVFKFGGASVKDATAVKNVGEIIRAEQKGDALVVVVSAMGKTTNELEGILDAAYRKAYQKRLQELKMFHIQIISELFPPASNPLYSTIEELFKQLNERLRDINSQQSFGQNYDSVVSFGERISTTILAYYLNDIGIKTELLNAPSLIATDNQWQEGQVDWQKTEKQLNGYFKGKDIQKSVWITQGFLGGTQNGETTTLGREGSDYSAAIFASCLKAKSLTIWKDVPGVLNGDPKRVAETKLFPELSYQEAAEMTYYGASVIHPKTIKPLANKGIPLFVRSFKHPEEQGTCIGEFKQDHPQPAVIFKPNQTLIKFEARDLSDINQRTLSQIIEAISDLNIKINLMMNTAVSYSICIDTHQMKIEQVVQKLSQDFEVSLTYNLELVTLKNYTSDWVEQFYNPKKSFIELKTAKNFQFVQESSLF